MHRLCGKFTVLCLHSAVSGVPYCLQSSGPSLFGNVAGCCYTAPYLCQKELFCGEGATFQACQHCLSLSVSEVGKSLFPWELDLRCRLLEPHLAGILLLGEGKSLLWGDASSGDAFGGSLLFPSQPVTCFSGNGILFFLPLALTCLPSILYHMRSEEWWITGWVRKLCCLF